MHPTLSVIAFTTLAGTGYGLWFLTGLRLLTVTQVDLAGGRAGLLAMLLAGAVLTTAGLLASLAHLGQPQRAWRALSQWRSSWLSREGIAALACFPFALAAGWLVWTGTGSMAALHAGGAVLAALALITVYCTARIYTTLRTIRAWHNRYVLPGYLLLGLHGGTLCAWLLAATGLDMGLGTRALAALVVLTGTAVPLFKHAYWRFLDGGRHPASPESATGLGRHGRVRAFEAPHTEANFVTREMGFVLARRHAARLRHAVLVLGGGVPLLAALTGLAAPALALPAAGVATFSGLVGIFVERWLLFAEARHAVMLYYGAARA